MHDQPLWICPRCGRNFANRSQTHTCAALGDLDRHFAGTAPAVRATFDRIVAVGLGEHRAVPIVLHIPARGGTYRWCGRS